MFSRHIMKLDAPVGADTAAQLAALLKLARQPSGPTRARLLSEIANIFLARWAKLSQAEKTVIGEILARLAPAGEACHRQALARRIAALPDPPIVLARLLAEDLPEIAEPILRRGRLLPDRDLVEIVVTRGREHRLAIASQRFLTPHVALALVALGDEEITLHLLSNDQARIGKEAFEQLVETARVHPVLHIPLLTRHDLPLTLMNQLFLVVTRPERKFIIAQNAAMLSPHAPMADDWRRQSLADAKRRRLKEARLVEILRAGRRTELAQAVASLAGLSAARAAEVIADPSCELMAIVAKACGIDRATFSTYVLLSDATGMRSLHETYSLLGLFEEVTEAVAERILSDWRLPASTVASSPSEPGMRRRA